MCSRKNIPMKRKSIYTVEASKRARITPTTMVMRSGRPQLVRDLFAPRAAGTARLANGRVITGPFRTGGYSGRFTGPNAEMKFFDTDIQVNPTTVLTTAPSAGEGQLCLIPAGDGQSNRDGRQCTIKSIHVKGLVTMNAGTGSLGDAKYYMYVVLDKQTNGAVANAADIFNYTANPFQAIRNMENSKRFTVLAKRVYTLSSGAGIQTAFSKDSRQVDVFKNVNIPLDFSSTTGALTELRTNNIFLVHGISNIVGGTGFINFDGVCRLRFLG